jgi:dipeptidyl-peptidase-4
MSVGESYPRQSARTRRFTLGEPRAFTVCGRGRRLLFLRALSGTDPRTGLWCLDLPGGAERLVVDPAGLGTDGETLPDEERDRRERVRESASGVVAYSVARDGTTAAFAFSGALHVVDLDSGRIRQVGASSGVFDPQIDPTGRRVAYLCGGALRCLDLASGDDRSLLEGADAVSWGRAEHIAAEEMHRFRGFWWSPDGLSLLVTRVDESAVSQWWIAEPAHPQRAPRLVRYPAAGTANADVTLHHVVVGEAPVELSWDRDEFPYLARVAWQTDRPPMVQVQTRDQTRVRTLALDLPGRSTTTVAEDTDPTWVDLFTGVPAWFGDRVVRIADKGSARVLVVGDEAVTPADVYVRSVVSVDDDGIVLLVSYDDPTQTHVARWTEGGGLDRLTDAAGVHGAVAADGVVVTSSAGMDHFGQRHRVITADADHEVAGVAEQPMVTPSVRMLCVGPRRLRVGVVLPGAHRPGQKLPVLVDPYGGPHVQRVVSARRAWLEPQWLADQGFAVVVADGRGTPGRSPEWDKQIHRDLAATLDDQVEALHEVAAIEPALDLGRVAIRGWSFGGYLAALAVLRRPDVFHAAVAGAPVTDWSLYDTHYTERYLGDPNRASDVYSRNSLLDDAASLSRPLLLVHGLADDNVVAAHSLLFSQLLTDSGRAHRFLPLSGVTHMTPQEQVAENLLLLQVEFLRAALGLSADTGAGTA